MEFLLYHATATPPSRDLRYPRGGSLSRWFYRRNRWGRRIAAEAGRSWPRFRAGQVSRHTARSAPSGQWPAGSTGPKTAPSRSTWPRDGAGRAP